MIGPMLDDGADLYDDLICPPSSTHPSIVAGRYEIGDLLGCGHSGQVFAALDRLSGQEVALKLLCRGRELPAREVLALRGLRTPGVVRLLDDGVETGRAFIVMERVHGRAFPGDWKSPTWPDLRDVVISLLDVLARIHRLGLVHLDLKPDNVLVDDQGRVTVLDLGLVAGRDSGTRRPSALAGTSGTRRLSNAVEAGSTLARTSSPLAGWWKTSSTVRSRRLWLEPVRQTLMRGRHPLRPCAANWSPRR